MIVYSSHDSSTGDISTSKGNQIKMRTGEFWFKADYMGYEGAAEYLSSHLLKYTNIDNYVVYELEAMEINDTEYNGCRSKNFLNDDCSLVTLDRLFLSYKNSSIEDQIEGLELREAIKHIVDEVVNITGLKDFGKILTKWFEFDKFILNEDRHFNNIAVIYNNKEKAFDYCPLFDNGAAFLSDTRNDYPLGENPLKQAQKVKAKPFSKSFDIQVSACHDLYGEQLEIDPNICISPEVYNNISDMYGNQIAERLSALFDRQCRFAGISRN